MYDHSPFTLLVINQVTRVQLHGPVSIYYENNRGVFKLIHDLSNHACVISRAIALTIGELLSMSNVQCHALDFLDIGNHFK